MEGAIVIHSLEANKKKEKEKISQLSGVTMEEEFSFTDGGLKLSEDKSEVGEGETTGAEDGEGGESKKKTGEKDYNQKRVRDGDAARGNKKTGSGGSEKDLDVEGSGRCEEEAEKEERVSGGMNGNGLEWERVMLCRMGELEARIDEMLNRLGREAKAREKLEERCRKQDSLLVSLDAEIARLYENQKEDRCKIKELENKLIEVCKARDENDNVNGCVVDKSSEQIRESASDIAEKGGGESSSGWDRK